MVPLPRIFTGWVAFLLVVLVGNSPAQERITKKSSNTLDWPMFRGNPQRTNQSQGGAPVLEPIWRISTTFEKLTEQWMKTALDRQESRQQPILPSFFPIAVTMKTDQETMPLLIYRSHWGIHARDLSKNGKLVWDSQSDWSLDRIAADSEKTLALNQWLSLYLTNQPQTLFENSTIGTLSTDNKKVYVIDDLVLPPHPQSQAILQLGQPAKFVFVYFNPFNGLPTVQQLQWGQPGKFGRLEDGVYHNRLQAFDLASKGKLVWELGGRKTIERDDPFFDSYFLGPPLPVEGKLYVMVEKNAELRLVCIGPPKAPKSPPTISWIQALVSVRDKMLLDVGRRVNSVQLSFGEGILICPTNAGAILGVDLLTHNLL